MDKFLLALGLLFLPCLGVAAEYTCHAPANPERGFPSEFNVTLSPAEIGGDIILDIPGMPFPPFKIANAMTLSAGDPQMAQAFEFTLGLIAEEDISGVPSAKLATITHIEAYQAQLGGSAEILIYKIFAGDDQVGGTAYLSGIATFCGPK